MPEPDEAWWEVENATGQELVELNLAESPVVADAWGPNQLGDGVTLPAFELFRLLDVPCPRTYDQRAVGAAGDMAYRYEVEFACEEIVGWELAAFE